MFTWILSTKNFSKESQLLMRNYLLTMILIATISNLTLVFTSLYIIDLFGFALAGVLLSVMSFSQFIFDFPTGALSDLIGQRGVGVVSFIILGIGYVLIGTTSSFNLFILTMIIYGFGNGLFAGVVQTWFDNNYRNLMTQDLDRTTYGSLIARVRSFFFLSAGFSIFIGTSLAFMESRSLVFVINGIISILGGFGIFFLLKNFSEKEKKIHHLGLRARIKDYFKLIFEALNAVTHDKLLLSTIIGWLLFVGSLGSVFLLLILYPIFFAYTGNDKLLGLTQSTSYVVLTINVFFIGIFAKKFQKRHLPLFILGYVCLFLTGLIVILMFIPPTYNLNVLAIAFILLLFIFFDSFIGEIGVNLQSRVMIDLIPSKYRNSILSLNTSLLAILVTVLYSIVGFIVSNYGFIGGLEFMEILGSIGCLFLVPIFFSSRMKKITKVF